MVGGGALGPGEDDAGEGFGDEEAVPGAELPGAFGQGVEGADGSVDAGGELGILGRSASLGEIHTYALKRTYECLRIDQVKFLGIVRRDRTE